MSEGRQLVAGELILGEARTAARDRDEAVESLVREHARVVYRIAYAVLRSRDDAEDAVQETFVRVLRHSNRITNVSNQKAWLARIAWRVAIDKSKRSRLRNEVPLETDDAVAERIASSDASVENALHEARIGAELEKLIAALPRKLREPLILSTVDEMTPREVSALLGINEAAVRSRVFRARQILHEKLTAHVGPK